MKLIVGLGNPEEKYKLTRHNIGFMSIETLAKKNKIESFTNESEGNVYRWDDTLLVKPLTTMNFSGECVKDIVHKYKIKLENILIIHDDVSMPFGKLRLRASGSYGGHNGLKSILELLDSTNINRLKVGIDKPSSNTTMLDYVLGDFTNDEQKELPNILDNVCNSIYIWLTTDIQKAMTSVNK